MQMLGRGHEFPNTFVPQDPSRQNYEDCGRRFSDGPIFAQIDARTFDEYKAACRTDSTSLAKREVITVLHHKALVRVPTGQPEAVRQGDSQKPRFRRIVLEDVAQAG
jgi:hypothetical protein